MTDSPCVVGRIQGLLRFSFLLLLSLIINPCISERPCVAVGTWKFSSSAVEAAWEILGQGGCALDAAERGVNVVELDTTEQTYVGYGGLPNSEGEMEFDAAIMDGRGCKYGAVMALKGVKKAVSVARYAQQVTRNSQSSTIRSVMTMSSLTILLLRRVFLFTSTSALTKGHKTRPRRTITCALMAYLPNLGSPQTGHGTECS